MQAAAVDAALVQATAFAEKLVDTYLTQVAAGEVGRDGTGRASDAPILANKPPTALLYGRVQSGKTAAMILTSALCLDNAFRVILVLTADNVALVEQTANRFKALNGPRVFSSVADDVYEWEGQEDDIQADVPREGIVLVCAKDAFHLPRIIQFLQRIEAPLYPAIVFDDEADAATPDTTLAARSSGRANAPAIPSTINRRVIENQRPGEEGESIREVLPHSVYVQVTATPYILFLQKYDSAIRPNITFPLEPGAGYCGGEVFFGEFDPAIGSAPPVVVVGSNELQLLNRRTIPAGLASSIEFFLLSAAAKALVDGRWPDEGFKHLSHSSVNIDQHAVVANHIERHLGEIRRQIRENRPAAEGRFAPAFEELRRTAMPHAQDLGALLDVLPDAIRQAECIRVNSDTDIPRYGPRLNFVVGGNILGRGLTIEDLLVTYYVREAKTPQMDTVWQHARMYGYREPLMPFTRVYLPSRTADRFREIHESEEDLRAVLRMEAEGTDVPIIVPRGMRATRPNALDPTSVRIIRGGREQIFPRYFAEDMVAAVEIKAVLDDAAVPIADGVPRDQRPTQVPFATFASLIEQVPMHQDEPGPWHTDSIMTLVQSMEAQYGGHGYVYVRALEQAPPVTGWIRGRLNGIEIALLRRISPNVPSLALLYWQDADAPLGWYPTLVMPANSATTIFNPD
jgi:hypothetical protein